MTESPIGYQTHVEGQQSPSPARQHLDATMTEAEYQKLIVDTARAYGWKVYHVRDSRTAIDKGFPDLVLAWYGRVLFLEVKRERGRVRPEQATWLRHLQQLTSYAGVVRPSDWPWLKQMLERAA